MILDIYKQLYPDIINDNYKFSELTSIIFLLSSQRKSEILFFILI